MTLVLADELDISRGDMLVRARRRARRRRAALDATLCWLGDAPLDPRRTYLLRHTTREVRARIVAHRSPVERRRRSSASPRRPALATNDIGDVALTLAQPVFADRYADNRATGSFILIDEATNDTVAAGMIR